MWSIDYLEVPLHGAEKNTEDNQKENDQDKEERTSLVVDESFVLINPPNKKGSLTRDPSGDGYSWQRKLVHRGTLTLHTAFHRADNKEPAAITALAISKDHRALFVGDERGRVYSWAVSSKPGKGFVDHWVRDECAEGCKACGVKFTMYERRHHCRSCGNLFCSSCSKYKARIPKLKIHEEVRVCRECLDELNKQTQ